MQNKKKKWKKSTLTILTRKDKPEGILAGCKNAGMEGSFGPSSIYLGCMTTKLDCIACSGGGPS